MTINNNFHTNLETDYPDYLRDESRRIGRADSISFPETENQLKEDIAKARALNRPITIQGARTGVTGGAVPEGGHILNLSRMNKILDFRIDEASNEAYITVQPGVLLCDVQAAARKNKTLPDGPEYFFPPDVTENSAAIGGMAAAGASGAVSYFYGSTRDFVERIRVILTDGSALDLRRGKEKAKKRSFSMQTDTGRVIAGQLPSYNMPEVKNASGYFVKDNMDLVDLFVGSEGTLGVISEIELRLIPAPKARWMAIAFFPSEEISIRFVKSVRESTKKPVAIEYFGPLGLDLFREHRKDNPAFKEMPEIPSGALAAVYLEFHGDNEDIVEREVIEAAGIIEKCGGDSDAVWLASGGRDIERLKNFRHGIPEAVNMLIDERRKKTPGITKLGTDMAVPDNRLDDVMELYHKGLKERDLEYVIFGHIGDNHLHVNIIPSTIEEHASGRKLCLDWAEKIITMGGTVSAEHGIGKLKTDFLRRMYGDENIRSMQDLKKLLDPDNILNQGNLFDK